MTSLVKICGLTKAEDARVAVSAGADYLGFIHFPRSPRHLSFDAARALGPNLPDGAARVGVTVDANDEALIAFRDALQLTHIQAHGSESLARLGAIKALTGLKVIKVIKVADASDVEAAHVFDRIADVLLFDTKPLPQDALPGGTARAFPWHLLHGHKFESPTLVAGGLTPDTVATALRESGTDGVDVSSGVEESPAKKSHDLIKAFIAAAKNAS